MFFFENQCLHGHTCILVALDKRTESLGLQIAQCQEGDELKEYVKPSAASKGGMVALSSKLS